MLQDDPRNISTCHEPTINHNQTSSKHYSPLLSVVHPSTNQSTDMLNNKTSTFRSTCLCIEPVFNAHIQHSVPLDKETMLLTTTGLIDTTPTSWSTLLIKPSNINQPTNHPITQPSNQPTNASDALVWVPQLGRDEPAQKYSTEMGTSLEEARVVRKPRG